jgi:hypothetical protein
VSLGAVIAMAMICGITIAVTGYDRGHALSEGFELLTHADQKIIAALIRLWRSS